MRMHIRRKTSLSTTLLNSDYFEGYVVWDCRVSMQIRG